MSGVIARARAFVREELYYGALLLPLLRARHRALLASAARRDAHTYTAFHRSPAQLAVLTGPVLDTLLPRDGAPLRILIFAGSNGAEAYTLASALAAARPGLAVEIIASDLHARMVEQARAATYTLAEITQGLEVPEAFMARTFERVGDAYRVRDGIRAMVRFEQADLLDAARVAAFGTADLVLAQNVLFHLPPPLARQAFASVLARVRPGGLLCVDGMELDMRESLTRAARLEPVDERLREIYVHSRRHIPERWWELYYGNEPYVGWARHRRHRYGTIFRVPR